MMNVGSPVPVSPGVSAVMCPHCRRVVVPRSAMPGDEPVVMDHETYVAVADSHYRTSDDRPRHSAYPMAS